MGLGDPID